MLRLTGRTVILVTATTLVFVAGACGGGGLRGYTDSRTPGITVLPAKQGDKRKDLHKKPLRVPFGADAAVAENIELALEFMDQAATAGALYVSNVEIHLMSKEAGRASDCVTYAVPQETRDEQNRVKWVMTFTRPKCTPLARKIADAERPHEVRGYMYLPK